VSVEVLAECHIAARPFAFSLFRRLLVPRALVDNLAFELRKDRRMWSVGRPAGVLVSNCCVTETNVASCFSNFPMMRAKSRSERREKVCL
jgi:hypothetical protein